MIPKAASDVLSNYSVVRRVSIAGSLLWPWVCVNIPNIRIGLKYLPYRINIDTAQTGQTKDVVLSNPKHHKRRQSCHRIDKHYARADLETTHKSPRELRDPADEAT